MTIDKYLLSMVIRSRLDLAKRVVRNCPKIGSSGARFARKTHEASMSVTVNIGEAKARFSELIAKAEAGEEIIIARGNEPVARLVPLESDKRRRAQEAIARIRALRDSGDIKPVTVDEILAWRHEGHKY